MKGGRERGKEEVVRNGERETGLGKEGKADGHP